jgi:hypothetical protein
MSWKLVPYKSGAYGPNEAVRVVVCDKEYASSRSRRLSAETEEGSRELPGRVGE